MTQCRFALTRLPTRERASAWRRFCASTVRRCSPIMTLCINCWRSIILLCVTRGLRISACSVGGSSSPNHMSAARCMVKNCSGGNGSQRLPSSLITLVVMEGIVHA